MVYFIGIDIGTTGAKAVLMDVNGVVVTTATIEYQMFTPHPLWAEQNPDDWWNATCKSIQNVLSQSKINVGDVKGVGLTGQMHGLVTLDKDGKVLYPCIMWNDQRTSVECKEITDKIGFKNLLSITGNQVLPGFTAPKILWLRKNKPDIYSKINKVLLPKDYIRFKLTNEFFSDVSDASGTLLLNVKERKWSQEILNKLEIPIEWLPEVVESISQTGSITKQASDLTGLIEGTPVFAGGGDQAAGGIGAGVVKEGIVSIVLGTSGVVFTHSDKYRIEPEGKLHAFCHSAPEKWHLMGVTLSAAGSFRWYRDTFAYEEKLVAQKSSKDVYEILTNKASTIPAGSEGLFFLPYLSGERTPYSDPNAKGAFIGLSVRHTKAHLTRSVLEGVAYSLKDCFELISNLGIKAESLIISGGGAKSKLWRSIIADVFNAEIKTLTCTEGAPYGAAILAAVGSGNYKNVNEACEKILKIDSKIEPDKKRASIYNDFYSIYKQLYPQLNNSFQNISEKVNQHYGS
jgi:xylulokinase